MPQIINTNVISLNAQRNLNSSQGALQTSLQRLSSGLRINSSKDDAAGMAITERFTSQIRGLNQAARNANDGISLAQTAEGALVETTNALQRIRELAVQAANDTNSASDRAALQAEVAQLQSEINRIATSNQFNGKNLLDGTFTAQSFQVGANANQTLGISINNAQATAIGDNRVTETGTMNTAKTASSAKTTNFTSAGEILTVSGSLGTATTATTVAGDSAFTIAANVNAISASTNVTAKAITKATLGTLSGTGYISFSLFGVNSTAATVGATVNTTTDLSPLNDAINNLSATTGITSSVSTGTLTLTNSQGYDINIADFLGCATAQFRGLDGFTSSTSGAAVTLTATATDSSVVGGTLRFSSSSGFTISSASVGGVFSATTSNGSNLTSVSGISIGSQLGANEAIDIIDTALQTINTQRATLGAAQNRFSSVVTALQTTSENLSAARSRIQDADFAAETAQLTRNQILQQAGTAMLAQANALPNTVLSLLK